MKVGFIYPDFFAYDDKNYLPEGRIYLGIGYLSAVLKSAGHETALLHCTKPVGDEEIREWLKAESPDMIGFSSTTHMFRHVRRWAEAVKRLSNLPIICGGVHATIAPDDTLSCPHIDMICIGEGESALLELCEAMESGSDFESIESLWVKTGRGIKRNPIRPLPENLDDLPFPDIDIFKEENLCEAQKERGTVMASRGCPYVCTYCSNHAQRMVYPNHKNYVRFRSVDNVLEEVRKIVALRRGKLKYIRFDDDILTSEREWFFELSKRYKEEIGIPYICNARVNLLDEEIINAMADSGCSVVCMGIESGSEWIRREVLKRHMSNENIEEVFSLCRDRGMKTVSTNMLCLPFEDTEKALETAKLNARCKPDCVQVSVFTPYPGTDLYKLCEECGVLTDCRFDTIFDGRSSLKLESLEEPEFIFTKEHFLELVELYQRPAEDDGRSMERVLDTLLLKKGSPWETRKKILKKLCDLQKAESKLEWINY